jgi:hypothetical protein
MLMKLFWRRSGASLFAFVCLFAMSVLANAQAKKKETPSAALSSVDRQGNEQLAAARNNPLQLRQFLK